MPVSFCEDKHRLLEAYLQTVDLSAITVREASEVIGTGEHLQKVLAQLEQARKDSEQARLKFKQHCEEHGC